MHNIYNNLLEIYSCIDGAGANIIKAECSFRKKLMIFTNIYKTIYCVCLRQKSFALNKLSSWKLRNLVKTKNWEIDSFDSNRAEDSLVSARCWSNVLSNSFNWLGAEKKDWKTCQLLSWNERTFFTRLIYPSLHMMEL